MPPLSKVDVTGVYDKYVAFQHDFRSHVLATRPDGIFRESFQRWFRILDPEQFAEIFKNMEDEHRLDEIEKWTTGFRGWLKNAVEEARSARRRSLEFGFPDDVVAADAGYSGTID